MTPEHKTRIERAKFVFSKRENIDSLHSQLFMAMSGLEFWNAKKEAENAQLRAKLEVAITGIDNYLTGDYDCPRSHRPHNCVHGKGYYEECENCNDAHFEGVLAKLRAEPIKTEEGVG